MASDSVKNTKRRQKIALMQGFGSKCGICGYDRCPAALDFHHLDPKEKEFTLSHVTKSFETLKQEVAKCILVCRNCHAEMHQNLVSIPKDIQKFNPELITYRKHESLRTATPKLCLLCGQNRKRGSKKYCSKKCYEESKLL